MNYFHLQMIYVLAMLNLALGVFIFFVCFCRVVVSSTKVLGRVRLKFILLGPAALASGLSPIWGNLPSPADIFLMLSVAVGLMSETYQWKKGPPASVNCDTLPGEMREDLTASWLSRAWARYAVPVADLWRRR